MVEKLNWKVTGSLVAGLTLIMATYVYIMGNSANRATAKTIVSFSQEAINNWKQITTALKIDITKTQKSNLFPVIPKKFAAVDLVIYGSEIVNPAYKQEYQQYSFPRMTDKAHIITNEQGELQYNVGGVRLISLADNGGEVGAVFYLDTPKQIIDTASELYDATPMSGEKDGKGIIRYEKLENGQYVMGVFLKYQTK